MVVGLIPSARRLLTILCYQAKVILKAHGLPVIVETLNFPEIRLTVFLVFTFSFHHNSFSSDSWRLSVGFESHSFE